MNVSKCVLPTFSLLFPFCILSTLYIPLFFFFRIVSLSFLVCVLSHDDGNDNCNFFFSINVSRACISVVLYYFIKLNDYILKEKEKNLVLTFYCTILLVQILDIKETHTHTQLLTWQGCKQSRRRTWEKRLTATILCDSSRRLWSPSAALNLAGNHVGGNLTYRSYTRMVDRETFVTFAPAHWHGLADEDERVWWCLSPVVRYGKDSKLGSMTRLFDVFSLECVDVVWNIYTHGDEGELLFHPFFLSLFHTSCSHRTCEWSCWRVVSAQLWFTPPTRLLLFPPTLGRNLFNNFSHQESQTIIRSHRVILLILAANCYHLIPPLFPRPFSLFAGDETFIFLSYWVSSSSRLEEQVTLKNIISWKYDEALWNASSKITTTRVG